MLIDIYDDRYIFTFLNPNFYEINLGLIDLIDKDSEKKENELFQVNNETFIAKDCVSDAPIGLDVKNRMIESNFDFFDKYSDNKYVKSLRSFFDSCFFNVHCYLNYEYVKQNSYNISYHVWYHKTLKYGYHGVHSHGPYMCGLYVLNDIEYPTFRFTTVDKHKEFRKYHNDPFFYKCQVGSKDWIKYPEQHSGNLIIFPGDIFHEAIPLKSNSIRYVLGINSYVNNINNNQ